MTPSLPTAVALALKQAAAGRDGGATGRGGIAAGRATMIDRYRDRRETGGAKLSSDDERRAYLMHRFAATYAAVTASLAFLPDAVMADLATVADIGAGTGASSAAALAALPAVSAVHMVDNDRHALKYAGDILDSIAPSLGRPVAVTQASGNAVSATIPPSDMVLASYLLNELPTRDIDTLVASMWSATRRAIVIVEPGSRVGFAAMLRARNRLTDAGAVLVAPCPHASRCPLAPPDEPNAGDAMTDWCHFPVSFRSAAAGKGRDEAEKFSYLVALKPGAPSVAEDNRQTAGSRVIKAPRRRAGHVMLDLCTPTGALQQQTISKKDGAAYKHARAIRWGDEWPATSPDTRPHSDTGPLGEPT